MSAMYKSTHWRIETKSDGRWYYRDFIYDKKAKAVEHLKQFDEGRARIVRVETYEEEEPQ